MKKTVLIVAAIIIGLGSHSFGQKLEENKVDDFTKNVVKRTSWESLFSSGTANVHFRISNVGNTEFFNLKMMMDKVFSIQEGNELMLKLDDGDIVKLQNLKFEVTCTGCGAVGFSGSAAQGIEVSYVISKDDAAKLETNKLVKVRIYTADEYVEEDVKDKNAQKFQASMKLVD